VQFAAVNGQRSSSAAGTAVLAAALRSVDPAAANAAAGETSWRKHYPAHFVAVTRAAARSADAALTMARDGLAALDDRMCLVAADGTELPLAGAGEPTGDAGVGTETLTGTAQPVPEIRVPYRGRTLTGDALRIQLQAWVDAGTVEPGFALRVGVALDHPEWLAFPGRIVVVLGASSAMGPLRSLLGWGARVVAVDLPDPALWPPLLDRIRAGAGTVHLPRTDAGYGLDLVRQLPEAARWLAEVTAGQSVVLGTYVYADGATHVALSAAAAEIGTQLRTAGRDVVTAYLATPTDTFLVPDDVVGAARGRWPDRPLWTRAVRPLTLGHAFREAYQETTVGDDGQRWGLQRTVVSVQGPNYLLAKRAQRWRGMLDAHAGRPVSFTVAPSTWTRSVTKNRILAAAYRGAPRVGVEIFDEATSSALLAAKLVADVHAPQPLLGAHPETLFSRDAAHGGLWRVPFEPESALTVAALLGLPGTLLGRPHHPGR
jgi:hypothetical protein